MPLELARALQKGITLYDSASANNTKAQSILGSFGLSAQSGDSGWKAAAKAAISGGVSGAIIGATVGTLPAVVSMGISLPVATAIGFVVGSLIALGVHLHGAAVAKRAAAENLSSQIREMNSLVLGTKLKPYWNPSQREAVLAKFIELKKAIPNEGVKNLPGLTQTELKDCLKNLHFLLPDNVENQEIRKEIAEMLGPVSTTPGKYVKIPFHPFAQRYLSNIQVTVLLPVTVSRAASQA